MKRFFIDCRRHPGDVKRTLALSADTKEELLEAVVQHETKVHGFEDTSEFREQIVKKKLQKERLLFSITAFDFL